LVGVDQAPDDFSQDSVLALHRSHLIHAETSIHPSGIGVTGIGASAEIRVKQPPARQFPELPENNPGNCEESGFSGKANPEEIRADWSEARTLRTLRSLSPF
jgi:hypothetical protein